MFRRFPAFALVALLALLGSIRPGILHADTRSVTVPGSSNPWLAGMPDGSTDSGSDVAPDQSPVLVPVTEGATLTFDVTGSVSFSESAPTDPPDGSTVVTHSAGPSNNIANVSAPANALMGVFLDDTRPDNPANEASPDLDFSDPGSQDYLSLPNLKLREVFFIGDGRTSGGAVQQVMVPGGATRLYLGSMDGFGWYNNSGSFSVTVHSTIDTSSVPAPLNLHTTSVAYNRVSLAWSEPSSANVSIRILRKTPHDLDFATLMTIPSSQSQYNDDTITPGTTYTYRVDAVSGTTDVPCTSPAAINVQVPTAPPQLSISATTNPAKTSVVPGDTLTYILSYSVDSSGAGLTDATILDPLPTGTRFVSAFFLDSSGQETSSPIPGPNGHNPEFSTSAAAGSAGVIWYFGNLASGASGKVKLNVTVSDVNSGTSVDNSGYLIQGTSTSGSGAAQKTGATLSIPFAKPIDVSVKTTPDPVAPGADLKYDVTVKISQSTFTNFTLTDTLPPGASFLSATPATTLPATGKGKPVAVYDPAANKVTWRMGTVQPGATLSFTLHVQAPYDPDPGLLSELDNAGFIAVGQGPHGAVTGDSGQIVTRILLDSNNLNPPAPKVTLVYWATVANRYVNPEAPNVRPGEKITYTIDLSNLGNAVAKGVVLTHAVPSGLVPTLIKQPKGVTAPTSTGGALRWAVGDVNGGVVDQIFTYTVMVPTSARPGNVITAGPTVATATDLIHPLAGSPSTLDIPVVSPVSLVVSLTPDVNYLLANDGGEKKITYTVNFGNGGGTVSANTTIAVQPPPEAHLVTGGTPYTSTANGIYYWVVGTRGTLKPGGTGSIQFVLSTTNDNGRIVENAAIGASNGATVLSDTFTVPIYNGVKPWVKISAPLSTANGSQFTYYIDYGNNGDVAADDVVLEDAIPANATVVNASAGGLASGSQVTWSIGSLPAHSAGSVSVTVSVSAGELVNNNCFITEIPHLSNARSRRLASTDSVTRYAGSITTTVRPPSVAPNPLQAFWGWLTNGGSRFFNWITTLGKNPVATADLKTLNERSQTSSTGGADSVVGGNGLHLIPLGGGQAHLSAPATLQVTGGTLLHSDGQTASYTGSANSMHVGPDTVQHLLDAAAIVAQGGGNIVAQGGLNIVAQGGGNLISQDGSNVVSNDGGTLLPGAVKGQAPGLIPTGKGQAFLAGTNNVVSNDGGTIVSHDGGSIVSHDGGSLTQTKAGLVISTTSGIVSQGGGN